MTAARIIKNYFLWHYSLALVAWWRIYLNLLWFLYHFFSVPVIVRTLFSPWRRLAEPYPKGFNPGAAAETLVVNGLMRLFGLVVRLLFLSCSVMILSLAIILGWVALALWLVAPWLAFVGLILGVYLTFLT